MMKFVNIIKLIIKKIIGLIIFKKSKPASQFTGIQVGNGGKIEINNGGKVEINNDSINISTKK